MTSHRRNRLRGDREEEGGREGSREGGRNRGREGQRDEGREEERRYYTEYQCYLVLSLRHHSRIAPGIKANPTKFGKYVFPLFSAA